MGAEIQSALWHRICVLLGLCLPSGHILWFIQKNTLVVALAGNPRAGLRAGPGHSEVHTLLIFSGKSTHALTPCASATCLPLSPTCLHPWFPVQLLWNSCIIVFLKEPRAQLTASAQECWLITISSSDPLSTTTNPLPERFLYFQLHLLVPRWSWHQTCYPWKAWPVPPLHLFWTVAPSWHLQLWL